MSEKILEKILEKIKKLIAHEQSARSIKSTQEADAFAAKVQALINEYNFSPETIENLKSDKSDIDRELLSDIEFEEWEQILSSSIAEANSCAMLFTENLSVLVGTISDREIVKSLYAYFEKLCRDLTEKEMSVMRATGFGTYRSGIFYIPINQRIPGAESETYRASYLNGLATAIGTRLIKQSEKAKADASQSARESTALAIIEKKMAQTMDYVQENFDIEETDQTVGMDNERAFYAGVFTGEAVALTNKVLNEGENISDEYPSIRPDSWTQHVSMDLVKSKIDEIGFEKFQSEYQGQSRDQIIFDDLDDEVK